MKSILSAIALAAIGVGVSAVAAAPVAAQAQAKARFSTGESTLGALMDDAAAKAVLEKHIPGLVSNPQLSQARSITLKQLQSFAGDLLSDELLAKIDTDLAAIK